MREQSFGVCESQFVHGRPRFSKRLSFVNTRDAVDVEVQRTFEPSDELADRALVIETEDA